jgi:hypothetical protein
MSKAKRDLLLMVACILGLLLVIVISIIRGEYLNILCFGALMLLPLAQLIRIYRDRDK